MDTRALCLYFLPDLHVAFKLEDKTFNQNNHVSNDLFVDHVIYEQRLKTKLHFSHIDKYGISIFSGEPCRENFDTFGSMQKYRN